MIHIPGNPNLGPGDIYSEPDYGDPEDAPEVECATCVHISAISTPCNGCVEHDCYEEMEAV